MDKNRALDKLNSALGDKQEPKKKTASEKLLEAVAADIRLLRENSEISKEDRKKAEAVYSTLTEKIGQLQAAKLVMPDSFTVKNPVTEVTVKNQPKEIKVSPGSWIKTSWAKQEKANGLLQNIQAGFSKLLQKAGLEKYESKDQTSLRVVVVDSKGKEQDLALVLAEIVRLVNSYPRGSGGGSSSSTIDVSALATQATLAAINAKIPALGQALAAGSVPVVLTAAQLTTLTPLSSLTALQRTDLTYTSYDPGVTDGNLTLTGLEAGKHAEVYFIVCNNWNTDLLEFDIKAGSGGSVIFGFGLAKEGGIVAMHLPGAWVLASNTNPYFDRISGGAAGKTGITLGYKIVTD